MDVAVAVSVPVHWAGRRFATERFNAWNVMQCLTLCSDHGPSAPFERLKVGLGEKLRWIDCLVSVRGGGSHGSEEQAIAGAF